MTRPQSWLEELANRAAAAITGFDPVAPLGCHWHHNAETDQWELTVFVSTTEIVGGPLDGRMTFSRFSLDLAALSQAFDTIDSFHWQALSLGSGDELGPHVSIEGTYHGNRVWLRVVANADERFGVGRVVDTQAVTINELW